MPAKWPRRREDTKFHEEFTIGIYPFVVLRVIVPSW